MIRDEAIAEARALMKQHGVTAADLRAELQLQLQLEPENNDAPAGGTAEASPTKP